MARFEVFIPAAEPGSFDVTLRVDAANWMQALKTGFHKLGEQGLVPHNVMVDVQDDGSVHVTDANSARVFRIREMSEAEIAAGKLKPRPTPMGTPVPAEPVVPPPSPAMVDPVAQTLGPDAPLVGVAREVKDPHRTSGMDVPPGGLESHGDAGRGAGRRRPGSGARITVGFQATGRHVHPARLVRVLHLPRHAHQRRVRARSARPGPPSPATEAGTPARPEPGSPSGWACGFSFPPAISASDISRMRKTRALFASVTWTEPSSCTSTMTLCGTSPCSPSLWKPVFRACIQFAASTRSVTWKLPGSAAGMKTSKRAIGASRG